MRRRGLVAGPPTPLAAEVARTLVEAGFELTPAEPSAEAASVPFELLITIVPVEPCADPFGPEPWAGPLATLRREAGAFLRQAPETGGAIVVVLDAGEPAPGASASPLSRTRAALALTVRDLAPALAPRVRINAVTPAKASADPVEIARAALYLVDACAVTGQMIELASAQLSS
jgi:NAD(P)-dependent dehydrogenase (short-subunit alcohol dehydrogenase family)